MLQGQQQPSISLQCSFGFFMKQSELSVGNPTRYEDDSNGSAGGREPNRFSSVLRAHYGLEFRPQTIKSGKSSRPCSRGETPGSETGEATSSVPDFSTSSRRKQADGITPGRCVRKRSLRLLDADATRGELGGVPGRYPPSR